MKKKKKKRLEKVSFSEGTDIQFRGSIRKNLECKVDGRMPSEDTWRGDANDKGGEVSFFSNLSIRRTTGDDQRGPGLMKI